MNLETMIKELGDDADLLVRSDEWLEGERKIAAQQIDELINELRSIMLAQRAKRALQQKNMVAVQHISRDKSGNINDMVINIMNLPDALKSLDNNTGNNTDNTEDNIDEANKIAQLYGWGSDGYDLALSSGLR